MRRGLGNPPAIIRSTNMFLRSIVLSLAVAALAAGCTSSRVRGPAPQQQPTVTSMPDGIWLRTDGQSGRDNPALAAQFENDRAACTVGGGIERACMTRRGYVLVPQSQAEATAARLRAANPAMQQSYPPTM